MNMKTCFALAVGAGAWRQCSPRRTRHERCDRCRRKAFVKERIELARKQANFWQDYKFSNPTTKKIEPKQMYCERLEETAVCGGIYKF
jgi:hypothetical protein